MSAYESCDVGEYSDYKLHQECIEIINQKQLYANETINHAYNSCECNSTECSSYTVYVTLFVIFFIISINISSVFIYFHWRLKKRSTNITKINPSTGTVIY